MKSLRSARRPSPCRRLLEDPEEDPLAGIANLFDAAMVFAVALLIAFAAYTSAKTPDPSGEATTQEVPEHRLEKLERFRAAVRTAKGRGERLGVAYRLENGDVVYIPDSREKR